MTTQPFTTCLEAALEYAERGWSVLPLHSVQDSRCTCGRADCPSPGKHPRTPNGLKEATTNEVTIREWWAKWRNANVGILTGKPSGLIVLDVDPRHGGDVSLDNIELQHGPLPDTVEALTGGGGRHILLVYPGFRVRNKTNLFPGVDVRADGGYIVAPPQLPRKRADLRMGDVMCAPRSSARLLSPLAGGQAPSCHNTSR